MNRSATSTLSILLSAGLLFGTAACNKAEQHQTETAVENTAAEIGNEGEEAYNKFKTWVEDADRDTAYVIYDHNRDWNKDIMDRETAYNERVTEVDKYGTSYDEARRQEIATMKTRYETNWEKRKTMYSSYAKGNNMRAEYLSIPAPANDLSSLNATNIRQAYETFVAKVQANKATYTNDDWQIVDHFWKQLDDRKNEVQGQLTSKDKAEIAKAKTKYEAMKAASKTGNTAEKVGSDIKEGATDAGSKVGNAAEKTGDAVKEGGKKVGEAAKKVGTEAKEVFRKAEDKVDGKKDGK